MFHRVLVLNDSLRWHHCHHRLKRPFTPKPVENSPCVQALVEQLNKQAKQIADLQGKLCDERKEVERMREDLEAVVTEKESLEKTVGEHTRLVAPYGQYNVFKREYCQPHSKKRDYIDAFYEYLRARFPR